MVTKRDDDDDRRRRQGEYRAIGLGKVGRQSFAMSQIRLDGEKHERVSLKGQRMVSFRVAFAESSRPLEVVQEAGKRREGEPQRGISITIPSTCLFRPPRQTDSIMGAMPCLIAAILPISDQSSRTISYIKQPPCDFLEGTNAGYAKINGHRSGVNEAKKMRQKRKPRKMWEMQTRISTIIAKNEMLENNFFRCFCTITITWRNVQFFASESTLKMGAM